MKANLCLSEIFRITTETTRARNLVLVLPLALMLLALSETVAKAGSEPEIELSLSKSQIGLGEQTTLTVAVSGSSNFSDPVVPDVGDLDIIPQGQTQSVQIINTKVKTSRIFGYAVVPHKAGEFTIGPAKIKWRGRTYQSNDARLSVSDTRGARGAVAGQRTVIVEASVDNVNPYVGQQVTLLVRFAQRAIAPIRNARYEMPELPDFWSEGMEDRREYRQRIGGAEYLVTEIAVPLFPIKDGDITIGRIMFHYEEIVPSEKRSHFDSPLFKDPFGRDLLDDDFFKFFRAERVVRRTAHTKQIEIRVRPLPIEGRPEDFKRGVGSYSVTAKLSDDKA
ncbi:MAG: BatD family protein, partial [Candidatus Hydrogenedentota bacterium]